MISMFFLADPHKVTYHGGESFFVRLLGPIQYSSILCLYTYCVYTVASFQWPLRCSWLPDDWDSYSSLAPKERYSAVAAIDLVWPKRRSFGIWRKMVKKIPAKCQKIGTSTKQVNDTPFSTHHITTSQNKKTTSFRNRRLPCFLDVFWWSKFINYCKTWMIVDVITLTPDWAFTLVRLANPTLSGQGIFGQKSSCRPKGKDLELVLLCCVLRCFLMFFVII